MKNDGLRPEAAQGQTALNLDYGADHALRGGAAERATEIRSGGSRANRDGLQAEIDVANLLRSRGIAFAYQVLVGTSIYGQPVRADFLLPTLERVIEVKWQASGGSVDEKFPYLWLNAMHGTYPYPLIVLVAGGGAKDGAALWLRRQVDGVHLADVFTVEEFQKWANRSRSR